MTKVVRFLATGEEPPLDGDTTRLDAITLDGFAPPRYAAVEIVRFDTRAPVGLGPLDVVVDEEIRRGDPTIDVPFRMMSVARRNPALSRAEFADRWRAEAGNLGGETIPDEVRGLAYVQDHPAGDDPPVDAINEVWFDSLDDLRRRAEWFAARPVPADLFDAAASCSLYLRAAGPT